MLADSIVGEFTCESKKIFLKKSFFKLHFKITIFTGSDGVSVWAVLGRRVSLEQTSSTSELLHLQSYLLNMFTFLNRANQAQSSIFF